MAKIPVLLAFGAYGRKANVEDWESGKDFKLFGGPYFSIRDKAAMKADGFTEIRFLYYLDHVDGQVEKTAFTVML